MDYTKDKKVDFIPRIKDKLGVLANSFKEKYSIFRDILFPKLPKAPLPIKHNYRPNNRWD